MVRIYYENTKIINKSIVYILLVVSIYFLLTVINLSYIGIRAEKIGEQWIVQRVFSDGLASYENITIGSEIIEINGDKPTDNYILNKWLIIEQCNQIKLKVDNEFKLINFNSSNILLLKYLITAFAAFVFIAIMHRISTKGLYSKRIQYYYCFCIALTFLVLSLIPSSVGSILARIIFILAISSIPYLFLNTIIYVAGAEAIITTKVVSKINGILKYYIVANLLLVIINAMGELEYVIREYLSLFPIYFTVLFCIFSPMVISYINKADKNIYFKDITNLIITGLIPILFLYILPSEHSTSYIPLIVFIGNIVMSFIKILIISKAIRVKFSFAKKYCSLILTIYITMIFVSFIFISQTVPLFYTVIILFIELYYILSNAIELIKIVNLSQNNDESIDIFIAEERERQSISEHIHDGIIQEIIYISLDLKEHQDKISKDEVFRILEDTIYSLRELCTEIYPIMISEVGLIKTIKHINNEIMKKHNVMINIIVNDFDENSINIEIKNFILRSVRELINNSIKHGEAKNIYVVMNQNSNDTIFYVKDDGTYIDKKEIEINHLGINSIKEKLKLLNGKIEMNKNNGTEIKVTLPGCLND